jgi:gliding motility-associated-like protein
MTTRFYAIAYSTKGCKATDSVTVHVLCDGSQLFIPNSFTPNGDGLNDYFYPRGKGISGIASFRIFSRWGELLFQRENINVNDEQAGWDGTARGQKLSPDVYVYVMDVYCASDEHITMKGDISILR